MQRIGVIGFGFCGNLLVANLVRQTTPLEIYIVDEQHTGLGVAYSATHRSHLLNVRASNMSAFPDQPDHFMQWVRTHSYDIGPDDFAPRSYYGMYLQDIWADAQKMAAEHQHRIKLIPSRAVAINQRDDFLSLATARGDAIAVDSVVLATGNDPKPVTPPAGLPTGIPVIQNPYIWERDTANWDMGAPVLLLGMGLTAADMVSSRPHSYQWPLYVRSRGGYWPHAHRDGSVPATIPFDEIPIRLLDVLAWLKRKARAAEDWRSVVDGLRPHTQNVWQRFTEKEQQQFFRRLSTFWSIHRHRMAPKIANYIASEIAMDFVVAQPPLDALQSFKARTVTSQGDNDWVEGTEDRPLGAIVNCTGWQLDTARSTQPLFKQLLDNHLIERHASGAGIRADQQHRAWGNAYPHIFAMGNLLSGQLLESTAVPELRVQAKQIAEAICK